VADLALEQEFVHGVSASTGYQRLMSPRRPSPDELRRFTDIDQERELALIATTLVHGKERQIGVARYVKEFLPGDAEFAIVLSDDWQGRGLGSKLLSSLLAAAKNDGVRRLVGTTMSENRGMLVLGRKLGFKLAKEPGSATITNLTMDLAAWSAAGAGPPQTFMEFVGGPGAWEKTPDPARQVLRDNAWTLAMSEADTASWPPFSCNDARRINVPVLLLGGDASPRTFGATLDKLQSCLPKVERRIIQKAGHAMPRANPSDFNSAVLSFIAVH
jgi:acetyltransferase